MKITEDIVDQYIISNEYVKPIIEIGHYYLEWNDKSYGIYQKEMPELKGFLKNVIPYFDAIYKMLHSLERPRGKKNMGLINNYFQIYVFLIIIKGIQLGTIYT